MSDERGDAELEGRLDEAFASLRPRADFEGELWQRLRRAPVASPRQTPWWTWAGAVAAVLLVGAFAFLFTHSQHPSGGAGTAANRAAGSLATEAAAFGALPRPPASAAPVDSAYARAGADTGAVPPAVSAPAGSLPAQATVVRYREPGPADVAGFAGRLGATGSGARYSNSAFTLTFFATDATLGLPAHYVLVVLAASGPPPATPPSAPAAEAAAQAFLAAHALPAGAVASVTDDGPLAAVSYESGSQVLVRGDGVVAQVVGPTGVDVQSSTYPLATPAQLAAAAHQPAGAAPRLATALVADGGYWFVEPVAIFGGVTVPAVDPSYLR